MDARYLKTLLNYIEHLNEAEKKAESIADGQGLRTPYLGRIEVRYESELVGWLENDTGTEFMYRDATEDEREADRAKGD